MDENASTSCVKINDQTLKLVENDREDENKLPISELLPGPSTSQECVENESQRDAVRDNTKEISELASSLLLDQDNDVQANHNVNAEENVVDDVNVKKENKHIFVLSSAGKPVYSRYGNEGDQLVTMCGVMQALVSVVEENDDVIQSIHFGDCVITFLLKGPIILVSVSQSAESVDQLSLQLRYVYNQIVSILTLKKLTQIFEERHNYDLRRLLAGSERLIDHLLQFTETQPEYLVEAVRCLPLSPICRDAIGQTIVSTCAKIKNLVFAILIADNQLITMVHMKKYSLQASDLHLVFNLVSATESFKAGEGWTPICLPNFDSSGYLHAYISYLAEDCQACLLLLTVDHELFFVLSEAKQRIVERLRRNNSLEAINAALAEPPVSVGELSVTGLRHCLYKYKVSEQLWQPAPEAPYHTPERLHQIYRRLHATLHQEGCSLKLVYQQLPAETTLGWITAGFEMYAVFDPVMTKKNTINVVNKVLQWIKQKERKLFIEIMPTF